MYAQTQTAHKLRSGDGLLNSTGSFRTTRPPGFCLCLPPPCGILGHCNHTQL